MSKYVINWNTYPNFRKEEFRCKCGKCNGYGNGIAKSLVETMQNLRNKYGKAINISSGYRCFDHNNDVGGSETSKHMEGLACDFYFQDGSLANQDFRIKIVNELAKTKYCRYTYCNVNGNHPNMGSAIHVDTFLVDIPDNNVVSEKIEEMIIDDNVNEEVNDEVISDNIKEEVDDKVISDNVLIKNNFGIKLLAWLKKIFVPFLSLLKKLFGFFRKG